MKHRKVLVTLVIATLVLFGFIGIASAHTPSVSPSCSGLSVSLVSYEGPATNNRLQVSLDGVPTVTLFGTSLSKSYTFTKDVPSHTWIVVIDANLESGNPTQFDKTFTGKVAQCPSTTTSGVVSSTLPPTVSTTTPSATTTTSPATVPTTLAVPPASSTTSTSPGPPASEPSSDSSASDSTAPPSSPASVPDEPSTTPDSAQPADTGLPNDCDVNQTTGRGTYSDEQPCGPATILDSYPTTTDVAVAAPPVRSFGPAVKLPATGTDLSDVEQSLPVTGSETTVMLGIALALAAAGVGLVAVARIHRGKS